MTYDPVLFQNLFDVSNKLPKYQNLTKALLASTWLWDGCIKKTLRHLREECPTVHSVFLIQKLSDNLR